MSDLDELASAARGPAKGQDPHVVPDYMTPERPHRSPLVWVALALGICFGFGVTLVVIWLGRAASLTPPTAIAVPTTARAPPLAVAPTQPVARRHGAGMRPRLEDIEDPFQALDIYHLKRGVGNTAI